MMGSLLYRIPTALTARARPGVGAGRAREEGGWDTVVVRTIGSQCD